MAPALALGADAPTNIVCATVEARAWLHVYELIARICLQNRKDASFPVSVTNECDRTGDFAPNSPAKLVYGVTFNAKLMALVIGFDLRTVLQPSQWINAVVSGRESVSVWV